jgi:N-acyl amino acid synthase of PEP-CTERM/exosortase system
MDQSRLFDHEYETILADTREARRIHHQLRYRVFCEETGFEDEQSFPADEEFDHWDQHAIPFIVRSRNTGEWVATLRLILPQDSLPSQQLCMLDRGAISRIKAQEVAELSRLCVLSSFRRNRYRGRHKGRPAALNQQQISEITLGLLRAAAAYSREQDIRYWYVLTTSGIARLMSRLHLPLQPIGTGIDHRGTRYPFLAHIEKSREHAERRSADFARLFSHPNPYMRYSALPDESPEPAWEGTEELELSWIA